MPLKASSTAYISVIVVRSVFSATNVSAYWTPSVKLKVDGQMCWCAVKRPFLNPKQIKIPQHNNLPWQVKRWNRHFPFCLQYYVLCCFFPRSSTNHANGYKKQHSDCELCAKALWKLLVKGMQSTPFALSCLSTRSFFIILLIVYRLNAIHSLFFRIFIFSFQATSLYVFSSFKPFALNTKLICDIE